MSEDDPSSASSLEHREALRRAATPLVPQASSSGGGPGALPNGNGSPEAASANSFNLSSSTLEAEEFSSETSNVYAAQTASVPAQTAVQNSNLASVVSFLRHPKVVSRPQREKEAFLLKKGISAEEIAQAMAMVASDRVGPALQPGVRGPVPAQQFGLQDGGGAAYGGVGSAPSPVLFQQQPPQHVQGANVFGVPQQQQKQPLPWYASPSGFAAASAFLAFVGFSTFQVVKRYVIPWLLDEDKRKQEEEEKARREQWEEEERQRMERQAEREDRSQRTLEELQRSVRSLQGSQADVQVAVQRLERSTSSAAKSGAKEGLGAFTSGGAGASAAAGATDAQKVGLSDDDRRDIAELRADVKGVMAMLTDQKMLSSLSTPLPGSSASALGGGVGASTTMAKTMGAATSTTALQQQQQQQSAVGAAASAAGALGGGAVGGTVSSNINESAASPTANLFGSSPFPAVGGGLPSWQTQAADAPEVSSSPSLAASSPSGTATSIAPQEDAQPLRASDLGPIPDTATAPITTPSSAAPVTAASAASYSSPASTPATTANQPQDYADIVAMVARGETPADVRDDIDDSPISSSQQVPVMGDQPPPRKPFR